MVEAILPLVNWIEQNRTGWVFLMEEEETTMRFAYDVSWIVLAYLNACILAAAEGDPGVRTPVYFQYLIDELDNGRYTGRALPMSLQDLLTVHEGRRAMLAETDVQPPPTPWTIYVDGRAGGGGGGRGGGGGGVIVPRGRCWNDRNREVIPNPCPIQCLHILSGENMWGMCRDAALPTLGGVAFCKRWHMGYICFRDLPEAASHLHPMGAIMEKVAAMMAEDRAARAATAAPT